MDELDLLTTLPHAEGYSAQDRYRDFRIVFNTVEGQRVLRELLSWGRLFRPSAVGLPVDPYLMAIREGERNFALRILMTFNQEPSEKPARARSLSDARSR